MVAAKSGVYFATAKTIGLTKIGCSSSLAVRIENLRCFCPDDNIEVFVIAHDDHRAFESKLHEAFKHLRRHGEWFALSESDIARIKDKYANLVRGFGGARKRGTREQFAKQAGIPLEPGFFGDKWTIRREIALAHWRHVATRVCGDLQQYQRNDSLPIPGFVRSAIHAWIDRHGYGQMPKGWYAYLRKCQAQGLSFDEIMQGDFAEVAIPNGEHIPGHGYVTVDELLFDASIEHDAIAENQARLEAA